MVINTKQYKEDGNPKLTEEQRREYADLKTGIQHHMEEGLRHFEAAGQMLLRMRDNRLYREEFPTFNDFCRATFQQNRRYADRLIAAFSVMEGLRAEGVLQLPDSERICRELAKYPKVDRVGMLKRAQAIAKRRDPTYLTIRDAATTKDIIPSKAVEEVWIGQYLEQLKTAKRALNAGVEFTGVRDESMTEVVKLLTAIMQRVQAMADRANVRIAEILKRKLIDEDD